MTSMEIQSVKIVNKVRKSKEYKKYVLENFKDYLKVEDCEENIGYNKTFMIGVNEMLGK